jgi:hypothetical protein
MLASTCHNGGKWHVLDSDICRDGAYMACGLRVFYLAALAPRDTNGKACKRPHRTEYCCSVYACNIRDVNDQQDRDKDAEDERIKQAVRQSNDRRHGLSR